MRANAHSRTAEVTAAIRASHYLRESPHLFEDPYALTLTSPLWRVICRSKLLHRLIVRGLFEPLRPVHGWILVRDQLTELTLKSCVEAGMKQYVLLGAGFDSIALRRPAWLGATRIIEVDYPATQTKKRERMASIQAVPDEQLFDLVAVDLEHEQLAEAISHSGFSPHEPALIAWQGVIYYLTDRAIADTLSAIAAISASGSQLMFDFLLPDHQMAGRERRVLSFAGMFTARLGERYISFHSAEDIERLLETHGFGVKRMWLDEELEQEFVVGRHEGLPVMRGFGIVHAYKK